jgi:hypothetical protein
MLWETKDNGNFRVVRLTRRFAFKTPRILEFRGLDAEWKQYGNPASKPSIAWLLRAWLKLFRQNRSVNDEEFRTYREWQEKGAEKVSGVGLCPILFHPALGPFECNAQSCSSSYGPSNQGPGFPIEWCSELRRDECRQCFDGTERRYRQGGHIWFCKEQTRGCRLRMAITKQGMKPDIQRAPESSFRLKRRPRPNFSIAHCQSTSSELFRGPCTRRSREALA